MTALVIVIAIALLLLFWAVGVYSRLVSLRKQFKNAFVLIDVQLKRRYDLIPNLVETARGYMKQERETLEAVIAVRNQAVNATARAASNPANADAVRQMAAAESSLTASLNRFFALSEGYPDFNADQNMMQLAEELVSIESRIAFARQAYNEGVMQYNNARELFPGSIIAVLFAFTRAESLQPTELSAAHHLAKLSA